jgi:hypothetical protein
MTEESIATTETPARYDQVPSGCWPACLAGLTGIPHDALARLVPDVPTERLVSDDDIWREYHNAINGALHQHGWMYAQLGSRIPRGFAIGIGPGPRGHMHSAIVLDGVLWHDPHPSRAGVERLTSFEIVVPILGLLSG